MIACEILGEGIEAVEVEIEPDCDRRERLPVLNTILRAVDHAKNMGESRWKEPTKKAKPQ